MVDLSFLEQFTKGDVAKMKRYISAYLEIAPETFRQMQQHLKDKEWEQLRLKAHALKPQSDYMGIEGLKATLTEIETKIRELQYEHVQELFAHASQLHTESMPQLMEYVGSG